MPMTRYRSCTLLVLVSIQTYLYFVHADDAVPLLYVVDASLYNQRHVLDVRDRPQDVLQLLHAVGTLIQVIRLALCIRHDKFGEHKTGRSASTGKMVVTSTGLTKILYTVEPYYYGNPRDWVKVILIVIIIIIMAGMAVV